MSYSDEFYTSLIGEVFDGYSTCDFESQEIFIKHINIRDQRYVHKYYERYKDRALSKGIESEARVFKRILDDGLWDESDDLKITSLLKEIENLNNTKKALFLPSKIKSFQETIDEKTIEYNSLKFKKQELVGLTAESYASNRASDEMLRFCLFKNPDLKENLYSEDEFDEIELHQVLKLNELVNENAKKISEENIKHAVLRPFFGMYISNCKDLSNFYGQPVIKLSAYQLKVAMYANVFSSIFKYVDDIPDNIKEDPDKLLAFSDNQRNGDSSSKANIKDDADGSAVFGATKEDMETISSEDGGSTISLSDELKKSGGQLDMKQMMRLAGHDV